MKKLSFLLLFILISQYACGPRQKGENEKKKIAVIISTLNNPWFVVLSETAANRIKELGYEANIFDSQNNTALESGHFENVITAGYSAILFNPTDADSSVVNVKKAKVAGIPVFCMDREVNSTEVATSQILSDNYSSCVTLGKYFVKKLNRKGTYT